MPAANNPLPAQQPVAFGEAVRTWARIGLLSFGGPAGQIAVMHRILVDEKRWISEQRFLHALSYCMLLPGPEAQQLATYVGWLLHGIRGGLVAGLLFVVPGFLAIMALSIIYVAWHQHPLLAGVFLGLKVAVIALVIQAMQRLATRALRGAGQQFLAIGAFIALAVFHAPFPLVIVTAGIIGYVSVRIRRAPSDAMAQGENGTDATPIVDAAARTQAAPTVGRAWRLLAVWLPLWFAPVILSVLVLGYSHVFTHLGVFFSEMAVVTFGGAYAVLTYVAQQAVEKYGWITAAQMADGLGLAETTPGPLILVVQFVGFLAAYQAAGSGHPLLAGVIGASITVWVTFVPCFLWIFLGAPYVERLRNDRALSSALGAITAAVVGVIANLACWFATHVLFARVSTRGWPVLDSMLPIPVALTAVALLLMFALRWSLAWTLAACSLLGAATVLLD